MGGWNRVGLKATDRRCGPFSCGKQVTIRVDADWLEAYTKGFAFRDFSRKLAAGASLWSYDGDWVNERFSWSEKHPGLGYPWLDHWN